MNFLASAATWGSEAWSTGLPQSSPYHLISRFSVVWTWSKVENWDVSYISKEWSRSQVLADWVTGRCTKAAMDDGSAGG